MIVTFDPFASPSIEIKIFGPNPAVSETITAIIDTGFTGFLVLPVLQAFPINLVPQSMIDITLADGSTHTRLAGRGGIHFEGQTQLGLVILEDHSTEALIGMEFLKTFALTLIVDAVASTVELRPS